MPLDVHAAPTSTSNTVETTSSTHFKPSHPVGSDSALSFIIWIGSYMFYGVFLLWAFVPDSILHSWGITYYPSRYYALAIPAYLIVLIILIIFGYIGWNMVNTNKPQDFATMRDKKYCDSGEMITKSVPAKYIKCGKYEGIPDFGDIDPVEMSKHLGGICS